MQIHNCGAISAIWEKKSNEYIDDIQKKDDKNNKSAEEDNDSCVIYLQFYVIITKNVHNINIII